MEFHARQLDPLRRHGAAAPSRAAEKSGCDGEQSKRRKNEG
jgi:hypothetical protein